MPPSGAAGAAQPARTCPRLAAATGSGDSAEKTAPTGCPSSCSMSAYATALENGASRSCSSPSTCNTPGNAH